MSKKSLGIARRLDETASTRPSISPTNMLHVSDTLESSNDIKNIDKNQIYPNPLNEKYMRNVTDNDIKALQSSIEEETMFHNLVVISDNDRYRLISGEKRWKAIMCMNEENYNRLFPSGIPCKVLNADAANDATDELILLLTCNVIVFSNGVQDPEQLNDLIKAYQERGLNRKEIVTFLSNKLKTSENTIRLLYNKAQAIKKLCELYESERITLTALGVLAQSKEDIQKKYVEYILDNYDASTVVNQAEAYNIKKLIKKSKAEPNTVESKEFITIRSSNDTARKTYLKIKKLNLNNVSKTESELCLKELKETQELLNECIKSFTDRIQNQ